MPPHRHEDRTSAEDIFSAAVEIFVEHGPAHMLVEFLAADLGRFSLLDLLPGFAHDAFIVRNRFFVAEAFHLPADILDQLDHQILKSLRALFLALFGESLQEIAFIVAKFFR